MLLPVHIAAGGIAMLLGAAALIAKKGGTLHRRSGLLFVGAMLLMGTSASILAFHKDQWGNLLGGIMTAYFVGTALTTVRPESRWTRGFNVVALIVVIGLAIVDLVFGVVAFNSPRHVLNGVPFAMLFFLGAVKLAAAAGDLRILRSGALRGAPRLARHLWRMCFALFIAAGSFFSIRSRVAKILPEPFTTAPMRALPIVLLFGTMFYWLWRVRRRRALPVILRHDALPPPAGSPVT